MQLSTFTPSSKDILLPVGPTPERAQRAARLLSEALALLETDRPPGDLLNTASTPDRLLRLCEVQRLTGLGRSAIYEQMQLGVFPQSVKASARSTRWSEAAVQAWIAVRLTGRTP